MYTLDDQGNRVYTLKVKYSSQIPRNIRECECLVI